MISAFAIAFTYSWKLTLVSCSILPFILIVYSILVPIFIKKQKSMEHADEKASSIASEVFGSLRMVVACGAESRMAARYSGWIEESRKRGLKMGWTTAAQFAPSFFAIYCTFALSFWFGIRLYSWAQIPSVAEVIM